MRCPGCGADNPAGAVTCSYCGLHLPQTPEGDDRGAVFDRIRRSPQFAERNSPERHARLPKYQAVHKAFFFVFFAMFIGGTFFIFVMALGMSGVLGFAGFRIGGGFGGGMALIPLVMSLVPLGMAAAGVMLFLTLRKKMETIETAPVEATPVIVVDKRTQVSGGGSDSRASTHYFVTCETEDGPRREYPVWDGALYGRMAAGDAGILYLRADHALDFDRVGR
jgi:hypothetical protein